MSASAIRDQISRLLNVHKKIKDGHCLTSREEEDVSLILGIPKFDPMVCPQCGGTMKIIAFLTDYAVVDRIIGHLKLSFVADRPPPTHLAYQEVLMAAEAGSEYSS